MCRFFTHRLLITCFTVDSDERRHPLSANPLECALQHQADQGTAVHNAVIEPHGKIATCADL
jgi:hypothetical protein